MPFIIACARLLIRFFHACMLLLPSEWAHQLFVLLTHAPLLGKLSLALFHLASKRLPKHPVQMGALRLDNRVGIAAGFDKTGMSIQALDALGFGFIEVGTITPNPQAGNPKPRIQKLFRQRAILNRMGFNNDGVAKTQHRLVRLPIHLKQKLMVSISKNKDSTDWLLDIKTCMAAVWFDCGAICVNISSPNTPGLRDLQGPAQISKIALLYEALKPLLGPSHLYANTLETLRYPMLACKLSPDLTDEQLQACCDAVAANTYGALVLTNTSIDHAYQSGGQPAGLSGKPLKAKANHALHVAASRLLTVSGGKIPLIGVGGILSAQDASEKYHLGASAVQLYTGFIFEGPKLLWNILEHSP